MKKHKKLNKINLPWKIYKKWLKSINHEEKKLIKSIKYEKFIESAGK